MNNWLKNLKVGDPVIVDCGKYGSDHEAIGNVEKIGKIHLTVGGEKYRISDGFRVGEMWAHTMLREPTPEALARAARKSLERSILRLMAQPHGWLEKASEDALIALRDALKNAREAL